MFTDVDQELWLAIGDPTRLHVLDLLLAGGPASASTLSRQLPVTRQAVAKHLSVLDRSGLVHPEQAGREVRYHVDAEQFARACAQLHRVSQVWGARLGHIKAMAEAMERARSE